MESHANSIIEGLRASYVQSLEHKCAEFGDAVRARNFRNIARLGHQLKGSGKSYGFSQVSELGARMETAADDRRIVLLDPMVVEFQELIQQLHLPDVTSEQP